MTMNGNQGSQEPKGGHGIQSLMHRIRKLIKDQHQGGEAASQTEHTNLARNRLDTKRQDQE